MMGMGGMDFMGAGAMGGMTGAMGGGMGGNEAMFKAALQSSLMGQSSAQLLLLLPLDLLQQTLIPQGHLGEIAQKCGIRIDLGGEVQSNACQVALTGPIAA